MSFLYASLSGLSLTLSQCIIGGMTDDTRRYESPQQACSLEEPSSLQPNNHIMCSQVDVLVLHVTVSDYFCALFAEQLSIQAQCGLPAGSIQRLCLPAVVKGLQTKLTPQELFFSSLVNVLEDEKDWNALSWVLGNNQNTTKSAQ